MSTGLEDLKRDRGALLAAFEAAGGQLNAHDEGHNSCPFCGDADGFSIFQGEGGIWAWKCWSKCGGKGGTVVDLLAAAEGLDDSAAARLALKKYGSPGTGNRTPVSGHRSPAPGPRKKEGKTHATPDDAVGAVLWRLRQKYAAAEEVKRWPYRNAKGEPVFYVVRFKVLKSAGTGDRNPVSGKAAGAEAVPGVRGPEPGARWKKQFAPIRREGAGWRIGLGDWGKPDGKPCPLYNLPRVLKAAGV